MLITTAFTTPQQKYRWRHQERLREQNRLRYPERRAYFKEWEKKNRPPGSRTEEGLKARYGISKYDYDLMLGMQAGVCAICHRPETKVRKAGGKGERAVMPLSVDHDHQTGRVRGLLCDNCNTGLGRFGDDPGLLQRAVDYLKNNARCNSYSEQSLNLSGDHRLW